MAPRSTYRLQLHAGFGFDAAAAVVHYLAALGVTHLYSSPYLQAAAGSTHGYDVVDHSRVNAELGGQAGHERLCAALGDAGLGQVLDIVPNHMAITGAENAWWWDVLENGPSSRFAAYFDVDWDPPEAKLRNTVLMPILADHYGRVLEAGELTLAHQAGTFTIRYFEHVLPVAPRSLDLLLGVAAGACGSDELSFVASALGRLPHASATDRVSVHERHRDAVVLRAQLERLGQEQPDVAAAIDEVVATVNGDPDALDALLERQNYRLAFWRTAGRELDYRRFFDITTLAGLRTEDEQVFADTHALVLGWLDKGVLDGLRIDHPDGLRRPAEYFRRLRGAAPSAWIVVEKILEPRERLPESWPVDGTTGYDFLNLVGGLFVDPNGEAPLTRTYQELTGEPTDLADVVTTAKLQVMSQVLAADGARLTELFVQVCERHRRYRDFTRHQLREALEEVIACFPVYRTYVTENGSRTDDDVAHVQAAVTGAMARRPDVDPDLLGFLGRVLVGDEAAAGGVEAELRVRFQQVSGPVMAKGVEDTAFYRYGRLLALCDVGGDPGRFGISVSRFHEANAERARRFPQTMLTTMTHDTKRSSDVRARITALTWMAPEWEQAVREWLSLTDELRSADGSPDDLERYFLFQTLAGAWPIESERIEGYMEKALREAKRNTNWVDQNAEWERAVLRFCRALYSHHEFLASFEPFVTRLARLGETVALRTLALKLTSPGVPDTYQGDELELRALVDPDNRRPVDWDWHEAMLARLQGGSPPDAQTRKLWLTSRLLGLRVRRPDAFASGDYEPLHAGADVVAFRRGSDVTVAVATRASTSSGSLPALDGTWRDVLRGGSVGSWALADLLDEHGIAVLERAR